MTVTRRIYDTGRELWGSTLHNNSESSHERRLFDRMRKPRLGDFVIEISSFDGYDPDGVGHLRALEYAEGIDPATDPEALPERYVVEPLDKPGVMQGWRNATFIALPAEDAVDWP